MSTVAAREILVAGAHAIAHVDGLRPTLQALLDPIADHGRRVGRDRHRGSGRCARDRGELRPRRRAPPQD